MIPVPLTRAKAGFSGLVDRLIHLKEHFLITKRGKPVAALIPYKDWERYQAGTPGGLASVHPPRENLDSDIEAMVRNIYEARQKSKARKPAF